MSTFTLAISCLTTSNLSWFMELTFQVPMQYCCLQHRALLLSPVTSTAGYSFCFGSIPSFFLELFLQWSPAAYWAPTDLGSFSFSILSFSFSYCSWGSQGKNTEVVCHWWNSSWTIPNPERWCCESAALNMPASLENSAVATWKLSVFIPIPKKGNIKECSN